MKKLLFSAILLPSLCFGYTITHNDYTTGGSITAAGQNTNENNIVNLLNGNIDTTNITVNTLTGSTANSGGSVGTIKQGTVSTPDFRINAVSTYSYTIAGSLQSNNLSNTVEAQTITTLGNPVFIFACETITKTGSGGVEIAVNRAGAGALTGNFGACQNVTATDAYCTACIITIDNPPAIRSTWVLTDNLLGGATRVTNNMLVFELRT